MYKYKSFINLLFANNIDYNVIYKSYNKIIIISYYCNLCKKKFTRKENLKRHNISVHIKDKKFMCIYCNKMFSRKDNLKQHMLKFGCKKNTY